MPVRVGGLFNDAGTVTLMQSTVAENNASEGGGLANDAGHGDPHAEHGGEECE